jgi:Phage integrase, N-terminal SAM-like domain
LASGGHKPGRAERLAANLAAKLNGRNDEGRTLTFGVYLTTRWLPGKKVELAHSTWDGYRSKIELRVLPSLGRIPIRRLPPHHLEKLYDEKLHPRNEGRPLAPRTVLEIHLLSRYVRVVQALRVWSIPRRGGN